METEKREEVDAMLLEPLPGQQDTEAAEEAEGASFLAFMSAAAG